MNFIEYQEKAKTTALYLDGIKEEFLDLPEGILKILGLAYVSNGLGEVGEVQGKIKKIIRDSKGIISEEHKTEIGKELGDVLWYIALMCEELGINMQQVAEGNIEKLFSRKVRGVIQGSGDNR